MNSGVLHVLKAAPANQNTRTGDLVMKIMYNAKERSRDDWEALFSAVDKRFKLVSIRIPPGAGISIIEVAWEG